MKRYFVIVESVTDGTPRILVEADGPTVKVWHPDTKSWVRSAWAFDYVYGDERRESVEITPESVEDAKRSKTLVKPGPG